MSSKGPRSKLDHETRNRRQKALEAPKEPPRPKTHWDHVLEEMIWLSKDFESERKWKLAQARKVALRASKGMLDQATKGERRVKEEEQRLRKVALNISKDIKKFWMKIEKLVLYKHQLELEGKKKKALDKQLEFLLGQTERYSTMLAENLVDTPTFSRAVEPNIAQESTGIQDQEVKTKETNDSTGLTIEPYSDPMDNDGDYDARSDDESEDDERTIDEDEALITEEERKEELAALKNDKDVPIEELLKLYAAKEVIKGTTVIEDGAETTKSTDGSRNDICMDHKVGSSSPFSVSGPRCGEPNGELRNIDFHILDARASQRVTDSAKDTSEHMQPDCINEHVDETTLLEKEKLAEAKQCSSFDEKEMLEKESEISVEELNVHYHRDYNSDEFAEDDSDYASICSEELSGSQSHDGIERKSQDESEANLLAVLMDEDDQPCRTQCVSFTEGQEGGLEPKRMDGMESENRIADAAAAARSAQPTGNTFSTTKVRTKFPFLLKHSLREYQHIGLDWLVTMYEQRLNGILADEMGLGKTIMTIALLAHLACEKGIWGPHLIVVPTSVMLNWETEFLKWCPAFKILTYFGSAKERKLKRQGWLKPNYFHVCITTYRLVIQDSKVFKRKKWKYLILDEAHLIKNWKSQRWQTLLNFNSKRRILLTGTPLQNDLMELWSLMHFLMPHIFQSHQEFKDWFCNPISGMVEGQEKINKEVIDRLHNVLRPFILRRLKRDVERQLPLKYEHVIYCRLSRRQRNLYEDFIASSETQATLESANFFGMIGVIMQLRKVCNHPDLFEGRPIISSFDMSGINIQLSSSICSILSPSVFSVADLKGLGFVFTHLDFTMTSWESDELKAIATPSSLIKNRGGEDPLVEAMHFSRLDGHQGFNQMSIFQEIHKAILEERLRQVRERASSISWWNSLRCQKKPIYSATLRELVTVRDPLFDVHCRKGAHFSFMNSSELLADMILSPVKRFRRMIGQIECFTFAIPAARAPQPICWCSKTGTSVFLHPEYKEKCSEMLLPLLGPIRPAIVRRQVYFPDRRLIQFDCGKLQELAVLLRRLKSEGHRALIFTQMTKMLDILEAFINLYGYTYMRLDGSTLPETRQTLMQRFNTNPKIFLFILSTRSGGVGVNLVGADTVIFYDSDWNPAMDQQAQDRCHRIGQTREVHIYRLISESTIEENILKKANQKRALDDLVIQSGSYNTEFFKKLDPMELFSGHRALDVKTVPKIMSDDNVTEDSPSNADVEAAFKSAEDEADYMALKKVEEEEAVENQEFTEETIGRLEDDEHANEDEIKPDDSTDPGAWTSTPSRVIGDPLSVSAPKENLSVPLAKEEDDMDMLADVRQMAAAAVAAGQEVLSFEDQLCPIDRYAMRFLELWDPIVDKAAMEPDIRFQEREWELDRIEKLKEDMEAEIDDDEEPLIYERWDADFATEAYRQQVEALAQHQLMEDLENEAREKDAEVERDDSAKNYMCADRKPKSKKKAKKAKFKSLKKGDLAFETKMKKEQLQAEPMSTDDEFVCPGEVAWSDIMSPRLTRKEKRKKVEAAEDAQDDVSKKFKKIKKVAPETKLSKLGKQRDESRVLKSPETKCPELKTASRGKVAGKLSITPAPIKREMTIRTEKLKKKGSVWSKDFFPSDTWLSQEDAILCAVVHEYGPHWSLVSEILYGMTAGGFYRGRYRHPVHCCERYRELIQRYILSTVYHLHNEKVNNASFGKAPLKVTEDNLRMLLKTASELPDGEMLLQKHFTALLSAIWRVGFRSNSPQNYSSRNSSKSRILFHANQTSGSFFKESPGQMDYMNPWKNRKLLAAALNDVDMKKWEDRRSKSSDMEDTQVIPEQIEVTLEFLNENDEWSVPLPASLNMTIYGSDIHSDILKPMEDKNAIKSSPIMAEDRFRVASIACIEGGLDWASSAFPIYGIKSRLTNKSQTLGKHKLPMSDSIMKPSKSKLKRVPMESDSMPQLNSEILFQMRPVAANESNLSIPDVGFNDDDFLSLANEEPPMEAKTGSMVQHHYIPGFISDLDDCSLSQDYSDFG